MFSPFINREKKKWRKFLPENFYTGCLKDEPFIKELIKAELLTEGFCQNASGCWGFCTHKVSHVPGLCGGMRACLVLL